jgi:DNA-binding PadR family transcriptional regulator
MAAQRIPSLHPKEALILELLVQEAELYGLQLVAASKGRLKRGTVYVTLGRMEEKRFITSRLEDAPADEGGLPRRIYEPTAFGRKVLKAYAQNPPPPDAGAGAVTRPGETLRSIAQRFCTPATMERLIDPVIRGPPVRAR